MSNKSRARFRAERIAEQAEAEEAARPDPEVVAGVDDMIGAFEKGDNRSGMSKWARLVLRDREKAMATPKIAAAAADVAESLAARDRRKAFVPAGELREPTAYEAAILYAMGNRWALVDRMSGPPMFAPVNTISGGVYGGTVGPARIAKRRARNKAARAARRGRTRRPTGHVYRSPFGYPVTVPGITAGVSIEGYVDAEVVDA